MKDQQFFSPGLLYSISPNDFSSLHLNEENTTNEFDWREYESQDGAYSLLAAAFSLLKTTAANWGVIKIH